MRTENFTIDEGFGGVNYNGHQLDIHNDYDFSDFNFDNTNRTACLRFTKSAGTWVPKNALTSFRIQFDRVTAVYTKEHDADYRELKEDASTIDMIGFSYDSDEIMDGPTNTSGQFDKGSEAKLSSLIFVFVTGKAIKVTADTATLISE